MSNSSIHLSEQFFKDTEKDEPNTYLFSTNNRFYRSEKTFKSVIHAINQFDNTKYKYLDQKSKTNTNLIKNLNIIYLKNISKILKKIIEICYEFQQINLKKVI